MEQQPTSVDRSNAPPATSTMQQQQPASATVQKHRTYPNTSGAPPKPHEHPSAAAQEQPISIGKLPVLQGRVFERLQRFAALPADLQDDAKQFQAFVEQNKSMLFDSNTHALIKSVYSVKGEALVDSIIQWLQARRASATATEATTTPAAVKTATRANQTPEDATPAQNFTPRAPSTQEPPEPKHRGSTGTQAPRLPFNTIGEETLAGAAKTPGSSANHLYRARQIAEALVLSGFVTPYKDDVKHLNAAEPEHFVQDNELLVPVAKNVTELGTTSVWSVVDGAVYAGSMKRKAGVLGQFTDGKDVYVVLNERTKKAYLFESDIARETITEMRLDSVNVDFDHEHFEFGVRVAPISAESKDKPELFNAGSKQVQTEFGNAWFSLGAQHPQSAIKNMVDADARGGVLGPDVPGKEENANASQMTSGQQEIRGADVAAPETSSAHQSHTFAARKDQSHGTPSDAAASVPLTGHDHHSQSNEGLSQRNLLDTSNLSQHQPDQHSMANEDLTLGTPYYGVTPPEQQQGQGFEAEGTGASKHHHYSVTREDPPHRPSTGGTGATMSKTQLDHHFRAQEDPSYDASYGSSSKPSTLHSGNREDMSRAGHVADVAAAKVANFVTSHHHKNQGDQGSAAPSNPAEYRQHSAGAAP